MHAPVFTDIDFQVDVDGRRGKLVIEDYVRMTAEPIRNKVTGAESRVQIVVPVASSTPRPTSAAVRAWATGR